MCACALQVEEPGAWEFESRYRALGLYHSLPFPALVHYDADDGDVADMAAGHQSGGGGVGDVAGCGGADGATAAARPWLASAAFATLHGNDQAYSAHSLPMRLRAELLRACASLEPITLIS